MGNGSVTGTGIGTGTGTGGIDCGLGERYYLDTCVTAFVLALLQRKRNVAEQSSFLCFFFCLAMCC